MIYTATWLRNDQAVSSEKAMNFRDARDIARSKLAAHRVRSGATHAEVRSDDGVLLFDSRVDIAAPAIRPRIAPWLARRWALHP